MLILNCRWGLPGKVRVEDYVGGYTGCVKRPARGRGTTLTSEIGFAKVIAAPTVFYWEERDVRCVVHGDDFTFSGKRTDLL